MFLVIVDNIITKSDTNLISIIFRDSEVGLKLTWYPTLFLGYSRSESYRRGKHARCFDYGVKFVEW